MVPVAAVLVVLVGEKYDNDTEARTSAPHPISLLNLLKACGHYYCPHLLEHHLNLGVTFQPCHVLIISQLRVGQRHQRHHLEATPRRCQLALHSSHQRRVCAWPHHHSAEGVIALTLDLVEPASSQSGCKHKEGRAL